jgi:Zn finger protein HypA/HybF involved in hydrogenase expression
MTFARVPFHGFNVPLIGISEDETMQECEDCHDLFCLLQMRLSHDGHFRCDKCTAHNAQASP